ncbi:MAG: DNA-binding domain-containing protein [Pseudomonadota bacterium]
MPEDYPRETGVADRPAMAVPQRPDASSDETAMAEALLAPDRPTPDAVLTARRFAVYRNNVVVGLIDAMAATYPAVQALVGETFFRAAAREFALAHPPSSPILIDWGGDFPAWIAAFPPAAGVPYLGDVARLEWAWNTAYNAAEAKPLDVAALLAVPPDAIATACVALHPSLALVGSPFPVVSIWAQATGRVTARPLDMGGGETALIVRPEAEVDVRVLDAGTEVFLQQLLAGANIAEAAARAGGDEDLLAERLGGLFQLRLAIDLVTAVNENCL